MHTRFPLKLALIALATGALVLTSGCAGKGGKNKDTAYVARDVDSLYQAAKDRLDRGDTREAAALFDEVERQHPYSPWARRAQLMSAFSYYVARDYSKSIQSAQRCSTAMRCRGDCSRQLPSRHAACAVATAASTSAACPRAT